MLVVRPGKLRVAALNVCSLRPKTEAVTQLLHNRDLDVLAISETWLSGQDAASACKIDGYRFLHRDYRVRGSGVGMYIRNNVSFKKLSLNSALEHIGVILNINGRKVALINIYRNHDVNYEVFYDELEIIVSSASLECENIFILGDMNIDLLRNNNVTIAYKSVLSELGLAQIIDVPTRHGALLDHLLVTKEDLVLESGVADVHFSDHDCIYCNLNVKKPKTVPTLITSRNFRKLDEGAFLECLRSSELDLIYYLDKIEDKVHVLTSTLQLLFDTFAPMETKRVSRAPQPWITDNIKQIMLLRDKAKLKYRRSLAVADRKCYTQLRNFVTSSVRREKKAYLQHVLKLSDQKRLYKTLNKFNIISQKSTIFLQIFAMQMS